MTQETQTFFSGCKNPFNVSFLITSLAAGNQIKSELVPVEILPHVTLLATIGLRSYEQQIIDDYALLLQRMHEAGQQANVARQLENGEQFAWLPGLFLVFDIAMYGPRGEYMLDEIQDAAYMFKVYEELINADPDNLFAWLGTASEQQVAQRQDHGSEAIAQKKAARSGKKAGKK